MARVAIWEGATIAEKINPPLFTGSTKYWFPKHSYPILGARLSLLIKGTNDLTGSGNLFFNVYPAVEEGPAHTASPLFTLTVPYNSAVGTVFDASFPTAAAGFGFPLTSHGFYFTVTSDVTVLPGAGAFLFDLYLQTWIETLH